jgi:hypothetical protein
MHTLVLKENILLWNICRTEIVSIAHFLVRTKKEVMDVKLANFTSITSFSNFSINACYMSIRENHDTTIAAEGRWVRLLGFNVEWSARITNILTTLYT